MFPLSSVRAQRHRSPRRGHRSPRRRRCRRGARSHPRAQGEVQLPPASRYRAGVALACSGRAAARAAGRLDRGDRRGGRSLEVAGRAPCAPDPAQFGEPFARLVTPEAPTPGSDRSSVRTPDDVWSALTPAARPAPIRRGRVRPRPRRCPGRVVAGTGQPTSRSASDAFLTWSASVGSTPCRSTPDPSAIRPSSAAEPRSTRPARVAAPCRRRRGSSPRLRRGSRARWSVEGEIGAVEVRGACRRGRPSRRAGPGRGRRPCSWHGWRGSSP